MGPLPTGPRSVHILKSHGPDTNMMKFYVTQNSTTYGKYWDKFKPRTGHHKGTGYSANLRPQVFYSTNLDEYDNPVMKRICSANYHTVTELSFQPYEGDTGKEPLPNSVHQVKTGFVRQDPLHFATSKEVKGVFIDTRAASAPANILPCYKPLLQKIQPKDPTELENHGYGPNYMVTETKQKFLGKQNPLDCDLQCMTLGPNTKSGFTHNLNVEPITYTPNNPYLGDKPDWFTERPTGISITQTSFRPWQLSKGNEPFETIANPSERGSGFTKEAVKPVFLHRRLGDAYDKLEDIPRLKAKDVQKNDPIEYLNMIHPNNFSSTHTDQFKGQQRPTPSVPDRLNTTKVGWQELSGCSQNNSRYVLSADDPDHYITNYMIRFQDENPKGRDRLGHTRGAVQRQKSDGYTMSTRTHSFGPDINTTRELRSLEPYVARSIKGRDPFYDDHTYDSKNHKCTVMA
ncbi:hypothetical protein C0Q70_10739 [Pomacea canaliculata]|uniref:Uncharacterized protein n=1 Tax=Pomacea canaliculata TaxID=400727 RepID=A0A2T7P406_POMCA|nr:protein phosphatase 1 regulatory subunit 32-like [Pomacea canaliculata]PVD28154.1 hypothetical protein C0Q70_10739 [Pomacea canaliculata]